jgi:hypothetical protein
MRRLRCFSYISLSLALCLPVAAQRNRIGRTIDSSSTVTLQGHVPPRAEARYDRGAVDSSFAMQGITLVLKPSAEQQAELDGVLAAQQDPNSAQYHQWLSPQEYADRFAPSQADVDQIVAWLQAQGFQITAVSATRNWISFDGTAGTVRSAFGAHIHRYRVDGEEHYANAAAPRIPAALGEIVAGFRGLDDFLLKAPEPKLTPAYTSTASGNHYLTPGDLATIYNLGPLYNAHIDGTGQNMVVVGQTGINLADIQSFRTLFGLAKNDPQVVLVPGLPNPGLSQGDLEEADLDLEYAGAIAPKANLTYVYSRNVLDAVQYAITQNLGTVISMSYGNCETGQQSSALQMRVMAQQANAQGTTWLASSGDSGAAGCDTAAVATHGPAVILPASIPEVTGVGGTRFNETSTGTYWGSNTANLGSALGYIPETSWNDYTNGKAGGASGGGPSVYFAKPSWQTGTPADGARDIPDVSLSASVQHDGAIICTGGSCASGLSGGFSVVGGTSFSVQVFAGIVALITQKAQNGASQGGLGNINPNLYALAKSSPSIYHDITTGNNIVPCQTGTKGCTSGSYGFAAGTGYDLVTGLGSVDGNALALASGWTLTVPKPPATLALHSLTISPSQVAGGGSATVTAILNGVAPTGGVSITLTGGNSTFPAPASISIPAGRTSASVSVKAGTVAVSTPVTLTASYGGNTLSATVTVGTTAPPPSTVTLSSLSISEPTGSTTAILTVVLSGLAPAGGITVALSSDSTSFPVPASVTIPHNATGINLQVTPKTVTTATTVHVTATYGSVSKTASITLHPLAPVALSSASISPASITGGRSATLTVTLSGPAPAGGQSITLSSNSPSVISVPSPLTMPFGDTSGTLRLSSSTVKAATLVTITVSSGGVSKTATVTVNP